MLIAVAVPVEALPAVVLFKTPADPVDANELIRLLIPILFRLLSVTLLLLFPLIVVGSPLVADVDVLGDVFWVTGAGPPTVIAPAGGVTTEKATCW